MSSVQTPPGEFKPGLAIGGGVLAGILTLAVISGIFWIGAAGGSSDDEETAIRQIGATVDTPMLETGDCVTPRAAVGATSRWQLLGCDGPHQAQISGLIQYPNGESEPYPGQPVLTDWLGDRCKQSTEAFIGVPILDTTLTSRATLPDQAGWDTGITAVVCSVQQVGGAPLDTSLEQAGSEFPRGDTVPVARLKVGDCFVPTASTSAYDLNSNSDVELVGCSQEHNGVFFGRATLDFAADADFPGQEQVGTATSEVCAGLFQTAYDKEADGFNYRYWRPNETSWDRGDRTVLCAVLDAEPLTEQFDPSLHRPFFELGVGDCFNLGPEETDESLRLDDQVRVIGCDQLHTGQMIGTGTLDVAATEQYQGEEEVLALAATECGRLFTDFVGISPFESEFRRESPIWYPNEQGWNEGDRRFACAYLPDEPNSESLADARR